MVTTLHELRRGHCFGAMQGKLDLSKGVRQDRVSTRVREEGRWKSGEMDGVRDRYGRPRREWDKRLWDGKQRMVSAWGCKIEDGSER
ncbi:hypothetical protein Pcinc_041233 [Petrolisthes cinctipes]|uniref:Uncharacterized protein n=1 Tax=Petrolisthes cinctipes TaxID=88211 RepID=A0AAE1BJY6_PETCI|nr:hypothetical protein Pcinc_041233 [Petrolisthes cinctipes]